MSSISKLTTDGPRIVSISQSSTLKQAAEQMLLHNVGCLIVNNENGDFVGLLTERDIAYKVARHSAGTNGPGSITVAEAMTRDVLSVPPGTPTSQAREIMATHRIRHLPIVDDGVVVGIVSARDLMSRQILEDRAAAEEVAMLSNCLKSIDLDEAAQTIVKEAPKLFGARHCVLCLFKENLAGPIEESNAGAKDPACRSTDLMLDAGDLACRSTGSMLALRAPARPVASQVERPLDKTHCAQDDQSEFYCESIPDQCEGLDAQPPRLVIPLTVVCPGNGSSGSEGRLIGCLCMCGLPPSVAANRELIAYKAGLAKEILTSHLTNAALYQQARITSLTDALTGAGSRKLLEDKLESESARADRYKRPFSVAIIDIDNFKTINDTLGHAAGDEAIRKIAFCMKSGKRTPDILVRYGGDEFVILMPETKASEASVLLERLRLQVHDIKLSGGPPLSMSCGIAEYSTEPAESATQAGLGVMRRADTALYAAKSAGKDCVKIWDNSMTTALEPSDIELEKIKKLQQRIAGLSDKAEKMFIQSIWGLVQALEAKDPYAGKHSENVTHYAVGIAQAMDIGRRQVDIIRRAAMIHDIGKIGIPDAITSKPGKLTPRERAVIEQHPVIAVRILEKMTFLEQEMEIVRHHHEKWNGQGYPDGLSRTAISVGARILAVADTFDALTSSRSYRPPRRVAEATKILRDSSGYEFDPEAVRGMMAWLQRVAKDLDKTPDDLTTEDLLHEEDQTLSGGMYAGSTTCAASQQNT